LQLIVARRPTRQRSRQRNLAIDADGLPRSLVVELPLPDKDSAAWQVAIGDRVDLARTRSEDHPLQLPTW